MAASYSHFTDIERDCLRRLQGLGKTPSEVAEMMGRDLSTVVRHFNKTKGKANKSREGAGRPRALTERQVDRIVRTTHEMVTAANSEYQVTAGMIRRALLLECSDRLVLNALHSRGIRFRKMRAKPVRTENDEKERSAFGKEYGGKPSWFVKSPECYNSTPIHAGIAPA